MLNLSAIWLLLLLSSAYAIEGDIPIVTDSQEIKLPPLVDSNDGQVTFSCYVFPDFTVGVVEDPVIKSDREVVIRIVKGLADQRPQCNYQWKGKQIRLKESEIGHFRGVWGHFLVMATDDNLFQESFSVFDALSGKRILSKEFDKSESFILQKNASEKFEISYHVFVHPPCPYVEEKKVLGKSHFQIWCPTVEIVSAQLP